MMATRNARADVMTLLLDLGADIDAQCAVRAHLFMASMCECLGNGFIRASVY